MNVSSGTTMTLADITASSYNDEDGDYDVFDWTGFVPFLDFIQTINTSGNFTGQYTYAPAGYNGANAAGWYAYTDTSCATPMNSVSVPFSHGFILNASDGNGGIALLLQH